MSKRSRISREKYVDTTEDSNVSSELDTTETNGILVKLGKNQRCDPTQICKDTLLYRPARIVVLNDSNSNSYLVRNQDLYNEKNSSSDWTLSPDLISNQCWTADQYTKIEKITMTLMAKKLKEEVGDCICQVVFTKQPDSKEMAKLVRKESLLIEKSGKSEAEKLKAYKKLYESTQKGEKRVIRGYISRSDDLQVEENETGMIKFTDAELMATGEYSERLINLRNIESLIFKLTKYELK